MSKAMVKKALDLVNDDDLLPSKSNKMSVIGKIGKKSNKKTQSNSNATIWQQSSNHTDQKLEKKKIIKTCLTLKKLNNSTITTELMSQLNEYRFGTKQQQANKQKTQKEESIFTDEDFKRFERDYNPVVIKR
ncbi:unnamed protein product [Didymodactylos carnosus]|uniref:Active regulator of SIRT1 n=1 Tax=Didymodactylos carnosus TaxID=1234261 RepID=A0A814GZG7_9BILA|nr:unnamed protein product [Didymodactylos carnosus]CAF1012777.1 unnamed protein product [Didymodactylos carnosus]CAF3774980.1 unnamed protein product [Didymodactylos carnosus]CAF3781627.1 unnamed protein product [Didymodactylos carnosus]